MYEQARKKYREALADRQDLLILALQMVDKMESLEKSTDTLCNRLTYLVEEMLVPGTVVPGENKTRY